MGDLRECAIFMNRMMFLRPNRIVSPLAWAEHVPFAFVIIGLQRPNLLVELGTHSGNSFNAFCQAVCHLGLPTQCYAVDTWKGDEHAGLYDESIWESLQQYNQRHYSEFSTLMRMTFDQALPYFSDQTVDLLHIDGCHGYEAVKHDFESWLPRISRQGIILLHDTSVRERGFGVWRLLEELKPLYPTFEFHHGYGLAVVGVGESFKEDLRELFELDSRQSMHFRQMLASIGRQITLEAEIDSLQSQIVGLNDQLHRVTDSLHQATTSLHQVMNSRSWRYAEPLRRIRKFIG